MTFERTEDWETVKQIVTHPKVYPHVIDDYAPLAEQWEPHRNPDVWYVLVRDKGELLGLWAFVPENAICWNVHTCLLPVAYGAKGRQAAKELATWVWQNTPCMRVTTNVPAYNRLAHKFALRAGMKEFGYNQRSYMKNGVLHDQVLLGMSRPGAI